MAMAVRVVVRDGGGRVGDSQVVQTVGVEGVTLEPLQRAKKGRIPHAHNKEEWGAMAVVTIHQGQLLAGAGGDSGEDKIVDGPHEPGDLPGAKMRGGEGDEVLEGNILEGPGPLQETQGVPDDQPTERVSDK